MTFFFFFNDPATTEIYTLPLHDALPILSTPSRLPPRTRRRVTFAPRHHLDARDGLNGRSEEHTSELQSLAYLVCRLLLEKKSSFIAAIANCNDYTNNEHTAQSRSTCKLI